MKTRRNHVAPGRTPFVPEALRRAVATVAAVLMGGSASLLACPLCFGAQETSLVDGTRLGILVLLIIVLVVQGAFAGFFFYLRKRAKHMADADLDLEWSELQGGASR
jgi:heme/copper-type cytochrome/quinol oxidase subunit 2